MKTTLPWCCLMDTSTATMWVICKMANNKLLYSTLQNCWSVLFQSLLSIRQDDKVVCPRTKEVFNFSQAEKVYIMWSFGWHIWSVNEIKYGPLSITCDLAYSEPPVELWSSARLPSSPLDTPEMPFNHPFRIHHQVTHPLSLLPFLPHRN